MSALTAMKLNEQIVSMRKAVEKARIWQCRRLIRQRKLLQNSKDEKKIRKVQRIIEEIDLCKKMPRDDISKFAIVNLKTLKDLLCKDKISVDERVLYKLACQETVIKSVEEFRKRYPNWQHEVPFLLQRLGMQYKSKRDAKKILREQGETTDVAGTSAETKAVNTEGVKMLVKKEIRKAVRKEENLEKKKKKLKKNSTQCDEFEGKPPPVLNLPKLELPKPVITKGQVVIKRLRLDGDPDDVFPSTAFFDETEDVVKEGNGCGGDEEDSENVEDDAAIARSLRAKPRNVRKRRRDFESEANERRSDVMKGSKSFKLGSSAKGITKKVTKVPEDQKLHPSWIAKKHEREVLEKLKASAKPKKIVFDDD